jgi:hypothetical protein
MCSAIAQTTGTPRVRLSRLARHSFPISPKAELVPSNVGTASSQATADQIGLDPNPSLIEPILIRTPRSIRSVDPSLRWKTPTHSALNRSWAARLVMPHRRPHLSSGGAALPSIRDGPVEQSALPALHVGQQSEGGERVLGREVHDLLAHSGFDLIASQPASQPARPPASRAASRAGCREPLVTGASLIFIAMAVRTACR